MESFSVVKIVNGKRQLTEVVLDVDFDQWCITKRLRIITRNEKTAHALSESDKQYFRISFVRNEREDRDPWGFYNADCPYCLRGIPHVFGEHAQAIKRARGTAE